MAWRAQSFIPATTNLLMLLKRLSINTLLSATGTLKKTHSEPESEYGGRNSFHLYFLTATIARTLDGDNNRMRA